MNDILQKIIVTKRQEIAQGKTRMPLDEAKRRTVDLPRPRDFLTALTRPVDKPLHLIAEVKKASPSAGVIRVDFDPVSIARIYESAGADALSVLTDEQYFQGRLEYIRLIRREVALPVLRKDFIVDPWQVYESRIAGADAILLIAECLETSELVDLLKLAVELHLTCLIEVHSLENFLRVREHVDPLPQSRHRLLGINNRDLRTFKTDLNTTLRLAGRMEDRSTLVSESGIHTRDDVQKLADADIGAALIGESLMRSADIAGKISELFGT